MTIASESVSKDGCFRNSPLQNSQNSHSVGTRRALSARADIW